MKRDWNDTHDADFELFRHFLLRFFDSELITTPGQWIGFLIRSLPFTASIFLIMVPVMVGKYRHVGKLGKPEWYRQVVFADELWLIALSMGVIGLLGTVKWQSLFPSRLDYLVLSTLPVKAKQIFRAKLRALKWVAGGAILILNGIPAVIFPMVSNSRFQANASLAAHIVVHFLTCVLASAFCFFALMACQGIVSNLLPQRYLEQVASYVQGLLIILMLVVITLSFSIGPPTLKVVLQPDLARWLPPVWFLALYQKMLGDKDPLFGPLALRALAGLGCAMGTALIACLLNYHRHRKLTMEGLADRGRAGRRGNWILDRLVPEPRQQAVLAFMLKTFARSSQHRLLVMGYGGLAVALTLSGIVGIGTLAPGTQATATRMMTTSFVYAHTVLLVFVLLGLRHVFAIPSELRANWMFQITEREGREEWLEVVERFVLLAAAIPILVVPFPLELALIGWRAVAESVLFAAALLVGYEFLFMEWEKLPFTCSYLPVKSPGSLLLFCLAGVLGILPLVTLILSTAVYSVFGYAFLLCSLAGAWVWAHHTRKMIWGQLKLIYDDVPEPAIRSLNLGLG